MPSRGAEWSRDGVLKRRPISLSTSNCTNCFPANIVKCRPEGNRAPKRPEIDTCTSLYLFEQINLIKPKLILLLGGVAVKKMLELQTVEEGRGKVIEQDGFKYIVSYHPASRFYREDLSAKIAKDFALLKKALGKL
jgi:uracil-DNA glycosylase family 4